MMKFALSLINLIIAFQLSAQPLFLSGKDYVIDSLKKVVYHSDIDSSKAKALDALSWEYAFSYPDSAIQYAMRGLEITDKLHMPETRIGLLNTMAQALSGKGNHTQALSTNLQALEIAEDINDKSAITWCLASIGSIYFYYEDYPRALTYFLQTKTYPEYFEERKRFYLGFIGEAYFHLQRYDSALHYIQQSYSGVKKTGFFWPVPALYMGKLHDVKFEYNTALQYYFESISREVSSTDSVKAFLSIAEIYRKTDVPDSGIYYAKRAYSISNRVSLYMYLVQASSILTRIYKSENRIDSAFRYQDFVLSGNDSLFSRARQNLIQNLTFNEQQRNAEISKEKARLRNQLSTIALSAGLIICVAIATILFRSNRYKKRAYDILEKQKAEIESQRTKTEQTLNQLKQTQSQLIQSEKMASLGELTAGIAHEIQNPLNFVNNFSEVNKELIAEMKGEMDKGNINMAKTIAGDIEENEDKINYHGKRADSIVKSMLQHSKVGGGKKEPSDLNALAEEYLRLSYLGMLSKDKSSQVHLQTDFDTSVGMVNIVPQDIGRVLVNLYNNAFYTVSQKRKINIDGYEPIVNVKTRRINDHVEIVVKDNGMGISGKVIDKIFQPFFTTKPTGQGTGLGLSLSYDIIKAHQGEIRVNSKEGEGAEFIIYMPLKNSI